MRVVLAPDDGVRLLASRSLRAAFAAPALVKLEQVAVVAELEVNTQFQFRTLWRLRSPLLVIF